MDSAGTGAGSADRLVNRAIYLHCQPVYSDIMDAFAPNPRHRHHSECHYYFFMIDINLPLLYRPDHLFWQFVMLFCGIMTIGLGSALYLVANLGPGARDGLMTGLQRRLGWPIMYVRSSIEMTAVLIGWLLGGIAGITHYFCIWGRLGCICGATFHGADNVSPQRLEALSVI